MCSGSHRKRDGQSFEAWFKTQVSTMLSAPSPTTFNSTFNSVFGSDADGIVNGRKVSRSGLKDALVALKNKWDSNGKLESASTTPGTDQNAAVRLVWKLHSSGQLAQVYCAACCCEESDGNHVDDLTLEGDATLFK